MADDDIRKYLPDTADILRRTDEEAAKKRLERALDNPDLDAALADMRMGMKEGEDPLYYDVKQDNDGAEAPAAEPVPGAAPAPVTAPVIVPAAGSAVPRPRVQLRPPRHAYARRRLSTAATIALAVMAVATPALLVAVLKQPATTNREPGAAASTVRVAATESVPASESASVPAESKAAVDGGVSAVHDAGGPAKLPVQSSPAPSPVLKPRPASPSSQPPPPEPPKPSPTTSESQPEF